MLARRDHSEYELREKLNLTFIPEHVDAAIEFARQNNWLLPPEVLAGKVGDLLHRKNKGINYISHYLKKKGLPLLEVDLERELEKALELARLKMSKLKTGPGADEKFNEDCNEKWNDDLKLNRATKEKIGRFLLARGFDPTTVRKVIYEKL